jgi:hypothetical protein
LTPAWAEPVTANRLLPWKMAVPQWPPAPGLTAPLGLGLGASQIIEAAIRKITPIVPMIWLVDSMMLCEVIR